MCTQQDIMDFYVNIGDDYFDESDTGQQYSTDHSNLPDIAINKKRSIDNVNERCAKRKRRDKSTYKHIPHREKPPHLVARRNARERKRVQAVNSAFARLRKVVPVENRSKRLSKVKTLQRAIEYINNLMNLLDKANEMDANSPLSALSASSLHLSPLDSPMESSVKSIPERNYELIVNKENVVDSKWHPFNSTLNGYDNEVNIYYQRCETQQQTAISLDSDINDIQKNYNYYYCNYFVNTPNLNV